jgi:hypothetical protein
MTEKVTFMTTSLLLRFRKPYSSFAFGSKGFPKAYCPGYAPQKVKPMCKLFVNADPNQYVHEARSIRLHGVATSLRLEKAFWLTAGSERLPN